MLTQRKSALVFSWVSMLADHQLYLLIGLLFATLLLIFVIFILWRRRIKKKNLKIPSAIDSKKFIKYCEYLKNNSNVAKSQFKTLGILNRQIVMTSDVGRRPENKMKNRYPTNILPYEDTRVKLLIDHEDTSSDYINASYVKGFSGADEYIATQGPLESTCKDFWEMIIQEKVSIIVMLTRVLEGNKEKCFKYFPNNRKKMSFGEYELRCASELYFGKYCVRTLKIQKNATQHTIIHMQYLYWPDFGVPTDTDNILQFCYSLRERATTEGGLIVVHCSAGVGRTGTIIAMDILLQTMDHHKEINVFNTVLELRKQRVNMVQTEEQYMFIHTCLKDALQNLSKVTVQEEEHLYANLENLSVDSLKII